MVVGCYVPDPVCPLPQGIRDIFHIKSLYFDQKFASVFFLAPETMAPGEAPGDRAARSLPTSPAKPAAPVDPEVRAPLAAPRPRSRPAVIHRVRPNPAGGPPKPRPGPPAPPPVRYPNCPAAEGRLDRAVSGWLRIRGGVR